MNPEIFSISSALGLPVWLIIIAVVWSLAWKGAALWKSARKNQPIWFIAILIINTLGILEILYLFLFSKMNLSDDKPRRRKSN